MSTKQEDFIILASNVITFSDTNSISNFRTKLARRRDFPATEDWRVAVTEITYKQSYFNVSKPFIPKFYTSSGDELKFGIQTKEVRPGFYSIMDLIVELNDILLPLNMDDNSVPSFDYDKVTQFVTLRPGTYRDRVKYVPYFGKEIETIIGFIDSRGNGLYERIMQQLMYTIDELVQNQDTYDYVTTTNEKIIRYFSTNKFEGLYPADPYAGFNNLFIYTNIVQHSDVGNAYVPILTTIPNKLSKDGWGGSVHHEPKNLIYRPLQMRNFDTIEIDIKDDGGAPIPFKLGNVILKLHFLKHG